MTAETPTGGGSRWRGRGHLRRLDRVWTRAPVFLVTITVLDRRPVLASREIAAALVACLEEARAYHEWLVGRYVIMPDHIHFFCSPGSDDELSTFVARFKGRSTHAAWDAGLPGRLWQREFHDHLLRADESYASKWEYVRRNPVRAGLCADPDDWPYTGEIDAI